METTQSRLAEFVKYTGLSDNQFTIKTGMSNGLLANIIKRGSSCTTDTLEKILNTFPELNIEWILRGEGSMLRSSGYGFRDNGATRSLSEPEISYGMAARTSSTVYIVPEHVVSIGKSELSRFHSFSLPWLEKGIYLAFKVRGDAMEPTFANGDYVIAKETTDEDLILDAHAYMVTTAEKMLVRRVYRDVKDQYLRLTADNEAYGNMDIPIGKITGLYQIVERHTQQLGASKERELIQLYRQLLKANGVELP